MENELKRQENVKMEMIHNISHDLKHQSQPSRPILSIKDGIYPYETLEKSVEVIIENADRLNVKHIHCLNQRMPERMSRLN